MRAILTSNDVKNIIETLFNGNLKAHKISPSIAYVNENSEEALIRNEITGEESSQDLAKYLNIDFYCWRNRIVNTDGLGIEQKPYEDWIASKQISMNDSFALVEVEEEEAVASQDIDSVTRQGRVTLLVQTEKAYWLDYYVAKIRANYLGKVQDYITRQGSRLKMFVSIGILNFDEEPEMTDFGECVQVSFGFSIEYMNSALTNEDVKVSISLNGYNGTYYTMPITKATYQMIVNGNMVPRQNRVDMVGKVGTSVSRTNTMSFFDFNTSLNSALNNVFWSRGASYIDGQQTTAQDPNIEAWLKIVTNGHSYYYRTMISMLEKSIINSGFNVCSITLDLYGKKD